MPKITISYRREDSGIIVGRLFDRLSAHYGPETVFRDIDNIPPGIDFRKYINSALLNTDILSAVVGPNWAGRTDDRTRITELNDPVRVEIEAALRKDIPVIPVLVANATMPLPNELPEEFQDFSYRNAIKLDALEDFDDHVRRLIRSLDRLLQPIGQAPRTEGPSGGVQNSSKSSISQPAPVLRSTLEASVQAEAQTSPTGTLTSTPPLSRGAKIIAYIIVFGMLGSVGLIVLSLILDALGVR